MITVDLIWPTVKLHGWKWMKRGGPVTGIIWHATRSGQREFSPETEYGATLNWFRSPNNVKLDSAGNPWYGGMSNYVVGGGRVCLAVPEEFAPRYSAGVHDFSAISIEVAQPLGDMPYDPRDIALCRELADDIAGRYGIPRGRVTNVVGDVVGEVGHEDTAQGKGQGKSDPGPLFWQAYLQEEDDMTPDEVLALSAGQFLTLLKQAIGVDDSTFSDQESVAAIRTYLTKSRVGEHKHRTTQQIITTGEVIV